jgi:Zn-dependent protease
MLAMAQLTPLFGVILICWIFSLYVHEFAHALVAYWGGDRSVVNKGYLSFHPFAYVDPVYSLLIPAIFLILGGLPLPGGAVRINWAALRSKHWRALVFAAGPAANFFLFLILAVIVHPSSGLVDPDSVVQPSWAVVAGAMCVLELWSVLFNLIPVPPLDGFGIIEPYLSLAITMKARSYGLTPLIIIYFLFSAEPVMDGFMNACDAILSWFGLPFENTWRGYNLAMFGSSE